MTLKSLQTLKTTTLGLALSLLIVSCGGGDTPKEPGENLPDDSGKVETNGVLNIKGQLFSIPSPVQTASLIQSSGAAYNKDLLNPVANQEKYITESSKALNLGIYGADLGYVTLYNNSTDATKYLTSVFNLAKKLDVTAAFDESTMKRFNDNITVKDSLLALVGIAYRQSDAYLKQGDRQNVSTLILAGGWIESLFFACDVNKQKESTPIKERIAEQKQSLNSIIKILSDDMYKADTEVTSLVASLTDLAKVYDKIEYKYVYEAPTTDANAKTTTLNSKTSITITKEQVAEITAKIEAIRNKIVNADKA